MDRAASIHPKCPHCKGTRQTMLHDTQLEGSDSTVDFLVCADCHVILGALSATTEIKSELAPPLAPPHPGLNRP